MSKLEDIRPSIERFVTALSSSLRLEIAVFDTDCSLFCCTPVYLKKKGRMVHAPSLREVMENGSVLVNEPGEMASCIGCRFKKHCPSTIEILCCIRTGPEIAGVLAFTSFTKEGQKRISEQTTVYLNAITETANLFGSLLASREGSIEPLGPHTGLSPLMELCDRPILFTDAHGVILLYNRAAALLLKSCDITSFSLWQLFTPAVVRRIMEENDLFEKSVSILDMTTRISTKTVTIGGTVIGYFVRISDQFQELSRDSRYFDGIIGTSPAIQNLQKMIRRIADSPTPVLITGESGTGKELIARAIHEQSHRNKYPFVAINCSSIPENLFESELFGYEEGAFTGAKKGGKVGKIEMAQGGTLFLDEIGEMPLFAQPKLLRILQEYELERVGSNKKIHLDIRIITATNRDLTEMVAEKRFRSDLFFRINVINLKLPSLRQRRDDILPIAESYLEKLKQRLETPLCTISQEAADLLLQFDWPGNVRQLQNVIEYAANLCDGDILRPEDLPESLRIEWEKKQETEQKAGSGKAQESESLRATRSNEGAAPAEGKSKANKSGWALNHSRKGKPEELSELFEKYGYTLEGKKRIAEELQISLRTLYRWMKQREQT